MKTIKGKWDIKYSQQPTKPDWFKPGCKGHYSVTSGTSVFNEWYYIPSRYAFNEYWNDLYSQGSLSDLAMSAFFCVDFEWYHGNELSPVYRGDELLYDIVPKGVQPASIAEMLMCASRF